MIALNTLQRPALRPTNPRFSAGPTSKRPGWSAAHIEKTALLGRSHRSGPAKARIKLAIDKTRAILGVPDDYLIGIIGGSDTGAFEAAMWTMLGARGVEVLAWEAFGKDWVVDILKEFKLDKAKVHIADYGQLPDLSQINFANDVVFTWNGTTSGVRVPHGEWIPANRDGLTLCDATSALFAMEVDWEKLDVVTYSWQKVMGGEAQHGMIILSPRAVQRLETFRPAWPVPKLFRMTNGEGKLERGIFENSPINTPSMFCLEDYIDTLDWAERIGGFPALKARSDASTRTIGEWVARTPWIDFLCPTPALRSNTGVCLRIVDPEVVALPVDAQAAFARNIAATLDTEGVAFDIGAYKDAPPGLRIWCGATVEPSDVEALLPWIEWAYHSTVMQAQAA